MTPSIYPCKISLIVAMDENRVIGIDNKLPWHLPNDLRRFKNVTMGHSIILGRKTFESIGKPLPGRKNIVVTRQTNFTAPGCNVVHSLDEAIAMCGNEDEAFVIGGAELYGQSLEFAQKLYVTVVHTQVKGDTFFPHIRPEEWAVSKEETHQKDEKNLYRYTFLEYERKPSSMN